MYLTSILKCIVFFLVLLLPVTIAESSSEDAVNNEATTETTISSTVPSTANTTNLQTKIGTIIDSLCGEGACSCPQGPQPNTENVLLTSIDCGSRMLNSMPQWNSTADPRVPNHLSVSFQYNHIQKIEPINTTNNFIQRISFRGNQINEISPFAFENLSNLKSLILAENRLEKIDHSMFKTNVDVNKNLSLEVLDLSNNTIVHIDDDAFEHLRNLKELILRNNPIHVLDASTIVSLNSVHNLEKLDLSNTRLKELPINDLINPIRNLKEMDLSYNLFNSVPETLENAMKLKKLNLDGNNIIELTAISFISLIELEELNINNMKNLAAIYDGTFTPLKKLSTLSCSNNTKLKRISTQSFINHFGEGPKDLKLLFLNNNNLDTINQETFIHMTQAKMEFKDNKLHCSCLLKWMQSEYGDLTCNTPSSLHSQPLRVVDFNNVPCETEETIKVSHIGLTLGISIVVIALLGSLLFIILRRRNVTNYPNAYYARAQNNDGCDFNEDL